MDDVDAVDVTGMSTDEMLREGLIVLVPDAAGSDERRDEMADDESPLAAARRWQVVREHVARGLDDLASAYAEMYASYVHVARAQQQALSEAGHPDLASAVGSMLAHVEGSLASALDEVERRPGLRIPGAFGWRHQIAPGHRQAMADVDPRPVLLTGPRP